MSTINLTDHNENIYNLVRRPLPPEDKFPKYQSKFHYMVRHKFVKPKRDHQTMGYAEVTVDPPNNFLKRNAYFSLRPKVDKHPDYPSVLGRPELKPKKKVRTVYDDAKERSPTVPREEKDFLTANILNAVRSVPRRPLPHFVDTVHGSSHPLEPSGLEPKYVFRKDFGKVPDYLVKRLKEEEKAREQAEEERKNIKPILRCISQAEREKLLSGLKHNWQELQTMFQGLPMLIDTVAKQRRKETLEKELKQLERDIATLERNPVIFVDEGAGDCSGSGLED